MRTLLTIALALVGCGVPAPPGGGVDAPPTDADAIEPTPAFTNGTSTLAGAGEAKFVDGPRELARFSNPVNVVVHDDKIYVADFDNNRVRVIERDGATSTVVSQNGFARPFGMAFAQDGTFYVSTDVNPSGQFGDMTGTVWRVNLGARKASVVASDLGRPRGLCALPDGRLAVADYTHHVVRFLAPTTGKLTPLAGAWGTAGMAEGIGAAARFDAPYQLVLGLDGALIVTDFNNNRLRRVGLDGMVTTLTGAAAGFVDGTIATARFDHPEGITIDAEGTLYVTDIANVRIRRILGSRVLTIAGDGFSGYRDADDNLTARFYGLEGLSVTPDGAALFVADGTQGGAVPYNRVRWIKL